MMNAQELQSDLNQFTGTEEYHRLSPLHGRLVCTDGVLHLAKNAECFWLIDVIASYQPQCLKDEMLRDYQFWHLNVKDRKGVLRCERDTDDVAITQEIPYTDFPLEHVKIIVARQPQEDGKFLMVAMLPSEY